MINPSLYKSLSDMLGELDTLGVEALSHNTYLAASIDNINVSSLDSLKTSIMKRNLDQISGNIQTNHVNLSVELRNMVVALQKTALLSYQTVDDFLFDNDVLVSSSFAALSDKCGYNISISNIE